MFISRIYRDSSLSAIIAGFIAVLVGFASAMAIVFQAAQAAGATQDVIESWVWALGIGMGVGCIGLSWWYKRPIIIAWSTPGAALLATSLINTSIEQAIGVFLFVGVLLVLVGVTGIFDKLTQFIPMPLASAMLAGILVQFGLGTFTALQSQPAIVGVMLGVYVLGKYIIPRYAIALVLLAGITMAYLDHSLDTHALTISFATPIWVTPSFSLSTMIGVGVPLFIVTMTSQNLPGVATLKASGYQHQPVSPIITATGFTTLLFAPFGGFTFNLAAITAAICTSDESHPNPDRRYIAGLSAGLFNILAGVLGASVVGLFSAFPSAMISALAGLALISTITMSLRVATAQGIYSEAAMLTFLITASGISFFGIASAFWGILLGLIASIFSKKL